MNNYTLGIDCWEGSLEIDEPLLISKGVEFNLIRLNSISGGHHMDDQFVRQWVESSNQIRVPYFIYNPWKTGLENFAWLKANLPNGVTTVAPDIEVKREGYSPAEYARQVDKFIGYLFDADFFPLNYTGLWFLPLLAYWPKNTEYWIARYLNSWYPKVTTHITWEEIKAKADKLVWDPEGTMDIPGPCALWQISGDRYVLPGTKRTTDINIFNGTVGEMIARYKLPPAQVPARLRREDPIRTVLTDKDKLERLWAAHPELHV